MKAFRIIRNYLCYCGIEKDEYNALKKDAYVSNFDVWRVLHMVMVVLFCGLYISSLFSPMMAVNRVFYMAAFLYFAAAVCAFFILKKDSVTAQLVIYLSISMLFVFSCLITQNKPDIPATTFIVLLLIYLLPGKCWTDSEGVVLAMPLQGQRTIPYSDITSTYISLRCGAKSNNYTEKRQLIHTMHIVAKGEDINFSTTSGHIGSPMMLADEYARAAARAESPFAEIVNTVKIHCGSNPGFDDIDW